MTEQYTEFQKRAIESVKRIWRLYVVNLKPEELESSFRMLPEDWHGPSRILQKQGRLFKGDDGRSGGGQGYPV